MATVLSVALVVSALARSTFAASDAFRVAALQSDCGTLYTVVAGDGCWAIADNAKITQQQLAALNPNLNCDTIGVGDGVCLFLACQTFYSVQSGDWCAKIADEQHVSADQLASLNPGLDCNTIFAGQRLCVAAPTVTAPPTPTSTPPPPGPTSPPLPTYNCQTEIPITVGDTCFNLATEYNMQLSQFTGLNSHLDCNLLLPGNVACVVPACGNRYHVQDGDWCAKIETDQGLASGDLVKLNPGISCDALAADQVLCAGAPLDEPRPQEEDNVAPGDAYPVWSPGKDTPQSPLLDFANAPNARKSFAADVVFGLDSQHKASFAYADRNSDGHIDIDELKIVVFANAHFSRGVSQIDSKYNMDNVAQQILKDCDVNGDGVLNQDEFMNAVAEAQDGINEVTDTQIENLRRRDLGMPEKRIAPLVVGIIAFVALIVGISVDQAMRRMEENARNDAADMLAYLDVRFWDRGNQPEPKCAVYMYYSTSCAALGTSWASHCSEGGEKVFPQSCNGLFTEGAKACGFLDFGCSSMCYKINTEGCDCDALNYTPEGRTSYCDTPISNTLEDGMGDCRSKCSQTSGCVGFTVEDDSETIIRCKTFKTMNCKNSDDKTSAFKLVGTPVGTPGNPLCPIPPSGRTPVPAASITKDSIKGWIMSNMYALKYATALRKRENATGTFQDEAATRVKRQSDTCQTTVPSTRRRRNLEDDTELERLKALETSSIEERAPTLDDYDPRSTYRFKIQGQDQSMWCAPSTLTSVVEGSIMKQFSRTTPKEMSVEWVAICRAAQSYLQGTEWPPLYSSVGNSYLATESCMPWNSGTNLNTCRSNQCGAGQYGKLPYITTSHTFWRVTALNILWQGTQLAEDIKSHLKNKGPVFMGFSISTAFQSYASALAASPGTDRPVFYDGHPSYAGHNCAFGHAMTVVGYFHYKRTNDPCNSVPRLVWIIQNSWGLASGRNGFVFVEYGSLAGGVRDETYGASVSEGSQWFSSELPHNAG